MKDTIVSESDIKAGQAVYMPFTLKIYNLLVLYVSNYWIWRCPKRYQLNQYHHYVTANHLDIGVGTGYYLKNTPWLIDTELSLMDLNSDCLHSTAQSMKWLHPKTYLADIFKPQEALHEQFDSISMNYLLHCLPGDMKVKRSVIENAIAMLKPKGVLFGATILSDLELQTFASIRLMAFYNKKQIFSNENDNRAALKEMLEKYLNDVDIKVMGCVALFKGIKKSEPRAKKNKKIAE